LSAASIKDIQRTLSEYVRKLEVRLRTISFVPGSAFTEAQAIDASIQIIAKATRDLERALVVGMDGNRTASFEAVREIWERASFTAAKKAGISGVELGVVKSPPLTIIGAYESIGGAGATWKTAVVRSAKAAGADLNAIVRTGLAEGIGPNVIAKHLRPYVEGTEDFLHAFGDIPGIDVQDFRSLVQQSFAGDSRATKALYSEAGRKLRLNADRIGFSEVYNARREAEVQHYAADPIIYAVGWRLSPDRGALEGADECDVLAENDFYGLGPGNYPVNEVPFAPHPWDRCETVPQTRPYDERGNPKPLPTRQGTALNAKIPRHAGAKMSREQGDRVRERTENLLVRTGARGPSGALAEIATEATALAGNP